MRALFKGIKKRSAPLTPNARLHKSVGFDSEWDTIFAGLKKGVYRLDGFIGYEKTCVFVENESYFERWGKVVVWYERESRRKKRTQTA